VQAEPPELETFTGLCSIEVVNDNPLMTQPSSKKPAKGKPRFNLSIETDDLEEEKGEQIQDTTNEVQKLKAPPMTTIA
jgi:hypothetical protein